MILVSDNSRDRHDRLHRLLTEAGLAGRLLTFKDQRVHLLEKGDGPPLLLVHGLNGSVYTWRDNIEHLARKFRVLAVDLPGFGLSDRPEGFPWNIERLADFLEVLLLSEGITSLFFIGHSLGGAIGPEIVRRCVLKLRKIILVAASIPGQTRVPDKAAANLLLFTYYDKSMVTKEMIEIYRLNRRVPDVNHCSRFVTPLFCDQRRENRTLADTPCLIVWGENDLVVPPDTSGMIMRWYRQPVHRIFQHCGHAPHEEYADSFNRLATEFLSDGSL